MSLLVQTLGGNSSLAALKAGFISAFSCIFVSELGDKTFFIAALLAMRRGRAIVLAGATSALAVMTIVSVAIGMIFHKVSASSGQHPSMWRGHERTLRLYPDAGLQTEQLSRVHSSPAPQG
jgi:cellobiose-specific phosphotransferase system component IIC